MIHLLGALEDEAAAAVAAAKLHRLALAAVLHDIFEIACAMLLGRGASQASAVLTAAKLALAIQTIDRQRHALAKGSDRRQSRDWPQAARQQAEGLQERRMSACRPKQFSGLPHCVRCQKSCESVSANVASNCSLLVEETAADA
jgi:hypothetical protein